MNLRIGLTGGIGSGKSTVAQTLAALGACVVDTDAISWSLTAPHGAAMPCLQQRFGDLVVGADGALDRSVMRQRMLTDPAAKSDLESILHPMISAEAHRQAGLAAPGQIVVFEVPLLAESHQRWRGRVDRILVVDCPEETQVQRVMVRSAWTEDEVRSVIGLQANRASRCALADDVILNDGVSLGELREQVRLLWRSWQPSPHVEGRSPDRV